MMIQYRRVKDEHRDKILFFRLGDFYETFFDDAELVSRELEIVLTGRDAGNGSRAPMAGIPYHAAEGYIARLLERGYKVALCDQVEDPKSAKGLVKREVTRVITPGTVTEAGLLDERKHNYLSAVAGRPGGGYGLAVIDSSTGDFAVTEITGPAADQDLLDELGRIAPAECLLPAGMAEAGRVADDIRGGRLRIPVTVRPELEFQPELAAEDLRRQFRVATLDGYGCGGLPAAIGAAGAVLAYLRDTQKSDLGHLTGLHTYQRSEFMVLDAATRRNLELTKNLREGGRRGTLLELLDLTVTAMGARLIRDWIERPLRGVESIRRRHDAVDEFLNHPFMRKDLRDYLRGVRDLERLAGRVAYGSANGRDLLALKASLEQVPRVAEVLRASGPKSSALADLADRLNPLPEVVALIGRAIDEEAPPAIREGGLIRRGHDPRVDELREAGRDGKSWIAALEARERERTGVRSLKVGFNKVFGYYIEVTRANLESVPPDYDRRQTLVNAERFITPELKEKEALVLGAEERLAALEYELFQAVREKVAEDVPTLIEDARILAELDAMAALGEAAAVFGYVRPSIGAAGRIEIKAGRHPVVERVLAAPFVPNDTLLDRENSRLQIITGPNMAGKSTYMRQVAQIVLMAQMGSFVPAAAAEIGVVDRLFTRVGASDDLAMGQSTFLVEMVETANILNHATADSLVILDEIGRGTSTFDGLSIAWAVAEYVADPARIGGLTLFATHYHELTELEGLVPGVTNLSVAVAEKGDEVVFLRRIVPGGTDRSYGLYVARLAGLPAEVTGRAQEILNSIEADEEVRRSRRQVAASRRPRYITQLALFESKTDPLVEELRSLRPVEMTPLEALNKLYELQEKARRGR
jgi:DNA mismatch repair protein MutS